MLVSSACELVFEYGLGTSYTHAHFWQVHGHARFYKELDSIGTCQINGNFKKTFRKVALVCRNL